MVGDIYGSLIVVHCNSKHYDRINSPSYCIHFMTSPVTWYSVVPSFESTLRGFNNDIIWLRMF